MQQLTAHSTIFFVKILSKKEVGKALAYRESIQNFIQIPFNQKDWEAPLEAAIANSGFYSLVVLFAQAVIQ